MGARQRLDQSRICRCVVALHKPAWSAARSFFVSDRLRPAILDVRPVDVIFVEENIVELPLIDHFPALLALIEVPFLRFGQLVKVSGIHLVTRAGIVV